MRRRPEPSQPPITPGNPELDRWATRDRAGHVENLLDQLHDLPPHPALASERANRHLRWSVQPKTGGIGDRYLCWVCFAQLPFSSTVHPTFRACRECLDYDRRMASQLGLKMLLPLMDWHTQPLAHGRQLPSDPDVRELLGHVWSSVSALNLWREDNCSLVGASLAKAIDGVDLVTWQQMLEPGPARSGRCWDGFVSQTHPRLFGMLNPDEQHD